MGKGIEDSETNARSFRPAKGRDPSDVPCLEVLAGDSRGRVVAIPVGSSGIGRAPSVHLQLTDDGVSRHHAEVNLGSDGLVSIRDRGSTNGTFVNGSRVEHTALREGDKIQIGPDVTLRYGFRTREELGARAKPAPEPPQPVPLSQRELEVARLAAQELSNAEIGQRLHISPRTVGTHLRNVYERIGVHSRLGLHRYLSARGWLESS